MVTVIVDKDSFFFTVFNTCDVSADTGLNLHILQPMSLGLVTQL